MTLRFLITTPPATKTGKPATKTEKPATTLDCVYTEGDTRTNPRTDKKVDLEAWQVGFDKIDIAPKDGTLSLEEICDDRDKKVKRAKSFMYNPLNWLNPMFMADLNSEIRKAERQTAEYRASKE